MRDYGQRKFGDGKKEEAAQKTGASRSQIFVSEAIDWIYLRVIELKDWFYDNKSHHEQSMKINLVLMVAFALIFFLLNL